MLRIEEEGRAEINRIPAEPHGSFSARFSAAAAQGGHDLVFFSDVFFNSGFWVRDVAAIAGAVRDPEAIIVIDGYHSFMAAPIDLAPVAHRAFYLSGGYKYAMAGEGVCFLHCPPGYLARPVNTGWYAEFAELSNRKPGHVGYATTGDRFAGATFDPSGIYRLNAVMRWLADERLTIDGMLASAHSLQRRFVDGLGPGARLNRHNLVAGLDQTARGRFLTFQTPDAQAIQKDLAGRNILTDARGDRLRIGFGIYHDTDDIEKLQHALKA
jgi:selenocysteine lyase/cysteine desulfurase